MIKSVTLKNFRGLIELQVPLSSVTMLTGTNGVGKTTVLEGLYCLFSQTRLDVSPIPRYGKTFGINVNQAANVPVGLAVQQSYDYKSFWDECPTYKHNNCSVYAVSDNHLTWSWEYSKAKLSDLDEQLFKNNPFKMDSSSEFALWNWSAKGKRLNKKTHKLHDVNETFQRVQLLTQDGGLYLLPFESKPTSICQYFDFASLRLLPQKLTFQTAKQLTKSLKILNPHITDVRFKDAASGLSVILDDEFETSLGTIGNGAITWASVLLAIYDLTELINQYQFEIPVIMLIDEIGAGIHYSVMLGFWNFLSEFCKQNRNIQFVFTSHSDDCIRAFCETFSNVDNSVDSSIVRLHRTVSDKKIIPTEYKVESYQSIISGEWEVRG